MITRTLRTTALMMLLATIAATTTSICAAAPVPVIYSTDLMHPHDDPDDHFDLACLYAMREADLRAVILDQGDRQAQRPGFKPVWQLNYQATNDPIAYLAQPTSAEDRDWMMGGQRNLWCGALLGLAVGRPLLHAGIAIVGFSPVEVSIDDQAVVRYGKAPGSRSVMRFEIKDQAKYAETATLATAQLLESFPVRNRP